MARTKPIVAVADQQTGEKVGICAIEVTSIPHISILQKGSLKRPTSTPNTSRTWRDRFRRSARAATRKGLE
jgi:hypothetical protein